MRHSGMSHFIPAKCFRTICSSVCAGRDSGLSRRVTMPPAEAFRFAAPGELARLLAEAGATGVVERRLRFRMEAPLSPEEFWSLRSEMSSTLREKLSALKPEERVEVAAEVTEALRGFFRGGRMSMPAEALIVTGRRVG